MLAFACQCVSMTCNVLLFALSVKHSLDFWAHPIVLEGKVIKFIAKKCFATNVLPSFGEYFDRVFWLHTWIEKIRYWHLFKLIYDDQIDSLSYWLKFTKSNVKNFCCLKWMLSNSNPWLPCINLKCNFNPTVEYMSHNHNQNQMIWTLIDN